MPIRFLAGRFLPPRMRWQSAQSPIHYPPIAGGDTASTDSATQNRRLSSTPHRTIHLGPGATRRNTSALPQAPLQSSPRDYTWNLNQQIVFGRPGLGMDHTWQRSANGQIRFTSTVETTAGPAQETHVSQDALGSFADTIRPTLPPQSNPQSGLGKRNLSNTTASNEDSGEIEGSTTTVDQAESEEESKPQSKLEYFMPEDILRAAIESQSTDEPQYWSYTMYQGPDGKKVTVHYCRKKEQSENIAKLFLGEKMLGFDLEWKMSLVKESSLKSPVPLKDRISLIQLASQDRIGLFHVAKFSGNAAEDLVPPSIKQIMEDENITKAGVNIGNDCNRLRKYLGIDSKGLFELSHLHRLVKYSAKHPNWVNKKLVSLAMQVEEHLQLPLKKDDVRTSDWTQELKLDQLKYASSDVYASVHLFDVLDMKRRAMSPVPPLPQHWEKKMRIIFHPPESSSSEDLESDLDEAEDDPEIIPVVEEGDVLQELGAEELLQKVTEPSVPAYATENTKPGKAAEMVLAETWATDYRKTDAYQKKHRSYRPGHSELRAYSLWQHHVLDVPDLAMMLSIKEATVASYVVSTVQREDFVYDNDRLRDVFQHIPANVIAVRFQRLFRTCADASGEKTKAW